MKEPHRPARRRIPWIRQNASIVYGDGYGWSLVVRRGESRNRTRANWIAATKSEPEITIGEFKDIYKALEGAEEWAKQNRREAS